MKPPRTALFLEREAYRRRRLSDAARVLPVVGFVLILMPVLWSRGDGSTIAAEAVYLFMLWALLVLVAAGMSRALAAGMRRERGSRPATDGKGPEPRR